MFDYTELKRMIIYKYGHLQDFSKVIKVHNTQLWRLLNGKAKMTTDMALKIADCLELKPNQIYEYFFTKKVVA